MATARLDLRLDEEIKAKAEKASALLGLKSLTEYVVRLMEEDADQVIEKYENFTIEGDTFDRFVDACNKAKAPNQSLKDALVFSDSKGIR